MQASDHNVQSTSKSADGTDQVLKIVSEPPLAGEATSKGSKQSEDLATTAEPTAAASPNAPDQSETLKPNVPPSIAPDTREISPAPVAANTTVAPPAPKRFSSSTISKEFMQAKSGHGNSSLKSSSKNHGATAPSPSRTPQPNAVAPSSRLVTAKLTTGPSTTATATGWNSSRANSSSNTANPSPVQTPGVAQASNKQLSATALGDRTSAARSSTPGRPWGDVKKPSPAPVVTNAAFPTAAEVARGKTGSRASKSQPSHDESPPADPGPDASADAFRGVHLDPKGHHWDEDDDEGMDFLGTVLEFGDGMQYSVPPTAITETAPGLPNEKHAEASQRVRKEDRFVDDFDRSWPRKPAGSTRAPSLPGTSPRPNPQEMASPAHSHTSTLHSEREKDKVLFNERSNRMEPLNEGSDRPTWTRKGADAPGGRGVPPHLMMREHPPPVRDSMSRSTSNRERPWTERKSSGDRRPGDMGPPPPPSADGRPWGSSNRRFSNSSRDGGLGLSSLHPEPPSRSHTERDFGRRRPPSFVSGAPVRMEPPSPRDRFMSDRPMEDSSGFPHSPSHRRRESLTSSIARSPLLGADQLSHKGTSVADELKGTLAQAPTAPSGDLDRVTKMVLHTGVEKARQRRMEEEAEREKQKERARAKAAELEAKMKATENEKTAAAEREKSEAAAALAAAAEKEKEKEKEKSTLLKSEPLPAASRRKLQLLPRSLPLPTPPTVAVSASVDEKTSVVESTLAGSETSHTIHFLHGKHQDLEEIDFGDMEKLMGEAAVPEKEPTSQPVGSKTNRPVASDFFEPSSPEVAIPSGLESSKPVGKVVLPASGLEKLAVQSNASPVAKYPSLRLDTIPPPSLGVSTRSPPVISPALKSPFLSSLTETLSRFKGAMQNITHNTDTGSRAVPMPVPPNFSLTRLQLSEPGTPDRIIVHISSSDVFIRPVLPRVRNPRWQVQFPRNHLMTFDPPIPELSPSTLSRDQLIVGDKRRVLRVNIPKAGGRVNKVKLPESAGTVVAPGKFGLGRGLGIDEPNWRRPAKEVVQLTSLHQNVPAVNTVSRSPPPALATIQEATAPKDNDAPLSAASSRHSKRRSMDGRDVSFYRVPSSDVPPPSVHFMVSSELEGTQEETIEEHGSFSSNEQHSDSKGSDENTASTLLTPPSVTGTSTWSQPALGYSTPAVALAPDADNIKAVWAQKGEDVSTGNSLKGIQDDLQAPITNLPDMKAEDLPDMPSSQPASTPSIPRRSLQDAHRAFQMVPTSPAPAVKTMPFGPPSIPPRGAEPPQPQPQPSPYLYARQPLTTPTAYQARPFAPPPNPNPTWSQPSPYMANATLAPRPPPVSSTGPSPPLPQANWMPPPQQPLNHYMAPHQFSYMHPPPKPAVNQPGVAPPTNPAYMQPGARPQYPGQMPHGPPPHTPVYPPRQPMVGPGMYHPSPGPQTPVYGMQPPNRVPPGRGGFELPPPATPNLYPQMQQRFHTPGW